jgi:multiple sugar transport system permease protein
MVKRKPINTILINCAAVFLMIFILAPFAWLFISSISPKVELIEVPPHWIPQNPTGENYLKLIRISDAHLTMGEIPDFEIALFNSAIISLSATALCVVVGIFAAYAFARLRFWMKNQMMLTIIGLRMLPEIALVLPLYMIMRMTGMADTKIFLVIVYSSFVLPFVIWILKGYFESIPVSMEEAALIDGAGRLSIIWNIVIPMSLPGIITTVIFAILACWDEFLFALIFTATYNSKTLTVAISEFTTRHMIDYGLMTTGGLIASLPPILIALLLQKYIISGLTEGSVKE